MYLFYLKYNLNRLIENKTISLLSRQIMEVSIRQLVCRFWPGIYDLRHKHAIVLALFIYVSR